MKILKHILTGTLIIPVLLGVLSCADISLDGDGRFQFVVTNGTGGPLSSVVIGETACTNVQAGDTCTALFNVLPQTQDVTYTGAVVYGFGEAVTETVSVTIEPGDGVFNYHLALDSDYAAIWVDNICETAGRDVDLVGIGASVSADTKESMAFLNVDGWASYSDYRGIENEEITYSDITAVNSQIVNADAGYIVFTAAVSGEKLTVDVTDEDVSDNLLDYNFSNPAGAKILKKSVVLMSQDGLTQVAADDGDGNLVSTVDYFDTTEGVENSIDYDTGELTYTPDAEVAPSFGTITAAYRYINAHNYVPKSFTEEGIGVWPGTIVVKMGDTIIAQEVYDEVTGVYKLEGENVRAASSKYDYTTNELKLYFFDDITADTISGDLDLEYQYRIVRDGNGDGNITDDGVGTSGGSIDYTTGIFDLSVDQPYFAANLGHTITGLYCRYHIPYVKASGADTIAGTTTLFDSVEDIDFDSPSGVVDGYLGQKQIDPNGVILYLTYYDAVGVEGDPILIGDDGSGGLLADDTGDGTPTVPVGNIDYNSGKIRIDTPQVYMDTGITLASARADQYNYYAVTASSRMFAGFFKKSDLFGRSFYALNMGLPPGQVATDSAFAGYWEFSDFDLLFYENSAGSTVMNLVCSPDNFN